MFAFTWRRWLRQTFGVVKQRRSPRRRGRPHVETLEHRLAPAAVITATLDDQTSVAVIPGGTIHYLVTVSNTGDADATNAALAIALDPNAPEPLPDNSTLRIGPLARRDSYIAVGNTPLTVGAASGLKVNDIDIDGLTPVASLALTTGTFTTTQGGSIAIAADGSFTYTPQTGDRVVTDTFVYTLTDGDGLVGTGTVTFNLNNSIVWYVDSSAGTTGDGSFNSPFDSLADVTGATGPDQAGEIIYVRERAGDYAGGVALLANQQLLGSDVDLTVNTITVFADFNTPTTLTNAAGAGITLASGNTVRGFTVTGTSGAGITGTGVAGGTIDLVTITSPGAAGVSLTNPTGTFTFGTATTDVNITGGAGGAAFAVSGGTASITFNGDITQAGNNAMVSVGGGHGTGTVTFQNGTLSASNGTGLQFDNADGTYNFSGTTTLNGGDAGIDILNGSTGTFTFGAGTTISNPTGVAFNLAGATASNANVTYSGSISKNNAGRIIDIDNHDAGTITFQTGTISASSTSSGIRVVNSGGGTINFNGQTTLSTGANAAVDIAANGATINFNAAGNGLDITTTSGSSFLATGGGTVTVQGSGNTISSGTGTALNIANTTIGANGVTFQSISTTAASANPGIVLNATGSAGGLTVTGTGTTAGSGGSISNKTGNGIQLTATSYVSLSNMVISNNLGSGNPTPSPDVLGGGIVGTNVTNFSLVGSSVTNNGNQQDGTEAGLRFDNLLGTATITNSTFSGQSEDHVRITNTSGTLTSLTVSGSTFGGTRHPRAGTASRSLTPAPPWRRSP